MAPKSTALTTRVENGTPYQLDLSQVSRAATALVQHIQKDAQHAESQSTKRNLLADGDDDSEGQSGDGDETPVWLVVTTKKHVQDKKKLKPGKM